MKHFNIHNARSRDISEPLTQNPFQTLCLVVALYVRLHVCFEMCIYEGCVGVGECEGGYYSFNVQSTITVIAGQNTFY